MLVVSMLLFIHAGEGGEGRLGHVILESQVEVIGIIVTRQKTIQDLF